MRCHAPFLTICALLLASSLILAGCTSPGGNTPVAPTSVPASVPPTPGNIPPAKPSPGLSSCGITTCHGLDLACGPNAPEICTMEYQLGDKCRQFASCDTSGGGCTLVTGPKFIACKTCVEQCQFAAGPDGLAAFSCEEKC